jgi:membrane protein YdbS with pleckstrin-like domain
MQSIKGIDARQADALRKTLQQYQQENESLKR